MAFLQQKHNLADVKNICEAQHNLGLKNMAYQCKDKVEITGGSIAIDNFKFMGGVSGDKNVSNYTLAATDNEGTIGWKQIPNLNVSWINDRNQDDIALSLFSNDLDYVKSSDFEGLVWDQIDQYNYSLFNETFINSNINFQGITVSNLIIHDYEMLSNKPTILTNKGNGSNFGLSEIVQSYSNTSTSNVVSANALSNLFGYVKNLIEESIPTDLNPDTLHPDSNLSDIKDSNLAVSNLGLDIKLNTKEIEVVTLNVATDLSFTSIDINDNILTNDNTNHTFLTCDSTGKIAKGNLHFVKGNSFLPMSLDDNSLITSSILEKVQTDLSNNIKNCLVACNVLSEIFESDDYKTILGSNLREFGIQEVAFSRNYNDLSNQIESVSSLDNDAKYISSTSNFLDIPNKDLAKRNLGLHTVATSGDFNELSNVGSLRNLMSWINDNEPECPFVQRSCNLFDLTSPAEARSYLQLSNMALQDSENVVIGGGDIINLSNFIISESNLFIQPLNANAELCVSTNTTNFVVLKSLDSCGRVEWSAIPHASSSDPESFGLCRITSNIENIDPSTALSANAVKDLVMNNQSLLFTGATESELGMVTVSSNYKTPFTSSNQVLNIEGASNLYNEIQTNIVGYDYGVVRTDEVDGEDVDGWIINEWPLNLTTREGVSNYVEKRLIKEQISFSELELTTLKITSELIWYPSEDKRNEIVDSNMYMTIMDKDTGQVTFSEIHGVGSNTGVENQTSLKIGNFWKIVCDDNTFELQKRSSDTDPYKTKHIFN